jgi:hypothetical protein
MSNDEGRTPEQTVTNAGIEWTSEEINAATRAYLWMLGAIEEGFSPVKKRVREGLMAGPLSGRSDGAIEYRFQNISSVLAKTGRQWVPGYPPHDNVGTAVTKLIQEAISDYGQTRHAKRVPWMVSHIPPGVVQEAALRLESGEPFEYPDSTDFDVVTDGGALLAPKRVIGFAALIFYNAPLLPVHFSGGESTAAFTAIRNAGLSLAPKLDAENEKFRREVNKRKKKGFTAPPKGENKPQRSVTSSVNFVRLPEVVAFVEARAKGECELCCKPAPFVRPNGETFLEVHHIQPLSEGGSDTVENAAALCPNCHRECHHGIRAKELRVLLSTKIAALCRQS